LPSAWRSRSPTFAAPATPSPRPRFSEDLSNASVVGSHHPGRARCRAIRPATEKNWIATIPNRAFFVNARLYAPTKAFFDRTWRPDDVVKVA
jgi:hypothetical protein